MTTEKWEGDPLLKDKPKWHAGAYGDAWPTLSASFEDSGGDNPYKSIRQLLDDDKFEFLAIRGTGPGKARCRRVVENAAEWEEALSLLMKDMENGRLRLVGFDIEGVNRQNWQKMMRAGDRTAALLSETHRLHVMEERPALIQISTTAGTTVIVQLALFPHPPLSLIKFCKDNTIFKVGVSIHKDAVALQKWRIKLDGWIDLPSLVYQELSVGVPNAVYQDVAAAGSSAAGLKKIASVFFGDQVLPFSDMRNGKMLLHRVSYSFWAAVKLNEQQLTYASFDSQVAADVAAVVIESAFKLSAIRPLHDANRVLTNKRLRNNVCRLGGGKRSPANDEWALFDGESTCTLRDCPFDANAAALCYSDADDYRLEAKRVSFVSWLRQTFLAACLTKSDVFNFETGLFYDPLCVEPSKVPPWLSEIIETMLDGRTNVKYNSCVLPLRRLIQSLLDSTHLRSGRHAPLYFNAQALERSFDSSFRRTGGMMRVHAPESDDVALFVNIEPLFELFVPQARGGAGGAAKRNFRRPSTVRVRLECGSTNNKPKGNFDSNSGSCDDSSGDTSDDMQMKFSLVENWLAGVDPTIIAQDLLEEDKAQQWFSSFEPLAGAPSLLSVANDLDHLEKQFREAEVAENIPITEMQQKRFVEDEIFGDLFVEQPWTAPMNTADSDRQRLVFATLSVCWSCGQSDHSLLFWEMVVPDDWLEVVNRYDTTTTTCPCNLAKLCADCVVVWRATRHEFQLELGAACGVSLNAGQPQFVTESFVIKLRSLVEMCSRVRDDSFDEDKEKLQAYLGLQHVVNGLLEAKFCMEDSEFYKERLAGQCARFQWLQNWNKEMLKAVPKNARTFQAAANRLKILLDELAFSESDTSKLFPSQVMERINWDVELAKSMFRRRFFESMIFHKELLPKSWCISPACCTRNDSQKGSGRCKNEEPTAVVPFISSSSVCVSRTLNALATASGGGNWSSDSNKRQPQPAPPLLRSQVRLPVRSRGKRVAASGRLDLPEHLMPSSSRFSEIGGVPSTAQFTGVNRSRFPTRVFQPTRSSRSRRQSDM